MADSEGTGTSRREELLAHAADIFWEKGYHATSMNDLADAMKMRKASLYHHIQSKEVLLYDISVSSMRHITDAATSASNADPEARLREIIAKHVQALLEDRSRHATGLLELRSLPPEQRRHVVDMRNRYDKLIDEAVREVQAKTGRWPDLDTKSVRLALLGMLNWTVFWFSSEGADDAETIARKFGAIFMPPV